MKTLKQILSLNEVVVEKSVIEQWIAEGWLKPVIKKRTYYFEDIDVARIQLIYELHFNLNVGQNSMEIVLSLLDQLYSTRIQLNKLTEAIKGQPVEVQSDIYSLIKKLPRTD